MLLASPVTYCEKKRESVKHYTVKNIIEFPYTDSENNREDPYSMASLLNSFL